MQTRHQRFPYRCLDELRDETDKLGINPKFSENAAIFRKPMIIGGKAKPNSLVIQRMKGI